MASKYIIGKARDALASMSAESAAVVCLELLHTQLL